MKKLLALLLSLMMLSCAAFAEEIPADAISLSYTVMMDSVPEGYTMEVIETDFGVFLDFATGNDDDAEYFVSVAADEAYEDYTLAAEDMESESIQALIASMSIEYNDPSIEYLCTEHGTPVIFVNENGLTGDYGDMFTIWHGYFIGVTLLKTSDLTETDVARSLKLLSDLWVNSVDSAVTVIHPLEAAMPSSDCTVRIGFALSDVTAEGINATVYQDMIYDAVEVSTLAEGSVIDYMGQLVKVQTVAEGDDGCVLLNGGQDNGGVTLVPYEGGTYYAAEGEEIARYGAFQMLLPFAPEVTYTHWFETADGIAMEDTVQIVPAAEMQSVLAAEGRDVFLPNGVSAELTNGQIEVLHLEYSPAN